jgi:hypothetical protein
VPLTFKTPPSSTRPRGVASSTSARIGGAPEGPAAALDAILASTRPIGFNVNLARVCGCVKAGLFLSQLLYWTRVGTQVIERDGWIIKSRDQMTLETGLTKHEQLTARKRLLALGLIEEARHGMPPQSMYRVHSARLGLHLCDLVRRTPVQWTLFDLRSNARDVHTLLGRNLAFHLILARVGGSVPAGVFISKALGLHKRIGQARGAEAVGAWFYLSPEQWQEDTGLTLAQVKRIKQELCLVGILHQAVQSYPRKKLFHRLDVDLLLQQVILSAGQTNGQASGATHLLRSMMSKLAQQAGGPGRPDWPTGTHQAPTAQELRSVSLGNTAQVLRSSSGQSEVTTQCWRSHSAADLSSHLPVASAPPPSFPLPANLNVRFSPGVRSGLTSSTAGIHPPNVRFSPPVRPVLTDSHARGSRDYRYLTTTTTTADAGRPGYPQPTASATPPPVVVAVDRPIRQGGCAQQGVPGEHPGSPQLIWPDGLSQAHRLGAARLMASVGPLSPDRGQEFLDELAAKMHGGRVQSPLALLGHLLRLDQQQRNSGQGELLLEHAADWRQRRLARAAAAERASRVLAQPSTRPAVVPSTVAETATAVDASSDVKTEHRDRLRALRQHFASQSHARFPGNLQRSVQAPPAPIESQPQPGVPDGH